MNTTEWTPRIETAERYLDAQYLLMASATGGAPIEETLARLDDVRRSRVAFNSIPPPELKEDHGFSAHEASDAVIFLEKRLKATKNEALVHRWLTAVDLPPDIRDFEKAHGLEIDPDHDLVIVGGSNADALQIALNERKFSRVIALNEVVRDEMSTELDEQKLFKTLFTLSNINKVRPNRIHYINDNIDETLRDEHLKIIKNRVELFYVSRNTNVLMSSIWTPNILRNIRKFVTDGRDILALSKFLLGRSAIVIGAGPSLDALLPKIAAVQDHVIIICAFKALKAVTSYGIKPDVVVCLDPKQKVRHLEGVDLSQLGAFAIEAASNDELVNAIHDCPILPFVASPVPLELLKAVGAVDIPLMATGGSAIHGAIQAALLLGCRSIYLAGADFGFPGNRLYAEGAGTGDVFTVADDGMTYKRQPLDSHYRGGELFPVIANDGSTIGASVEMIQFREWTEARIQRAAELNEPARFFNLCAHGAVVKGAPYTHEIVLGPDDIEYKPSIRSAAFAAKPVAKLPAKSLKSRFRGRADRLRKMLVVCDSIIEKNRRNQEWSNDLQKMIKQAKRCLEISTLINAHLIKLNEYTERVQAVTASEANDLILKLVKEAREATVGLLEVYAEIAEPSRRKNYERLENSTVITIRDYPN